MSTTKRGAKVEPPQSIDFSQLSPGTVVAIRTDSSVSWITTTTSTRACTGNPDKLMGVAVTSNSSWLVVDVSPDKCKIDRIITEGESFEICSPVSRRLVVVKIAQL
jgi:hypothetical protein